MYINNQLLPYYEIDSGHGAQFVKFLKFFFATVFYIAKNKVHFSRLASPSTIPSLKL